MMRWNSRNNDVNPKYDMMVQFGWIDSYASKVLKSTAELIIDVEKFFQYSPFLIGKIMLNTELLIAGKFI